MKCEPKYKQHTTLVYMKDNAIHKMEVSEFRIECVWNGEKVGKWGSTSYTINEYYREENDSQWIHIDKLFPNIKSLKDSLIL